MFTRVSILGSTSLAFLQLIACSASEPQASTHLSHSTDERVDQEASDRNEGTDPPPHTPSETADCDYREGQALNLDKLKWKNKLVRPREFAPTTPNGDQYEVTVRKKKVQMLPDCYPSTEVFAYGGRTVGVGETEPMESFSTPGPTFEMTRGKAAHVKWINDIEGDHLFTIDPTLHWANPKHYQDPPVGPFSVSPPVDPRWQSPVPIVTHVHGLEVAAASDGAPEAWFTPKWAIVGKDFPKDAAGDLDRISHYPNSQPATTLWYHDHALGITRLNVYAGLAGMYIIRDGAAELAAKLPDRAHEMPLVIQDRTFKDDGSLAYPTEVSEHHPYWASSFIGETIVVNGKVWPKMEVERTRYRFRVLNGANYRSFNLALTKPLPITVIGSDGGYLPQPADTQLLKLAPGERADVVIDFSSLQPGEFVVLNSDGEDVVGFEVSQAAAAPQDPSCLLTSRNTESKSSLPPLCFPNGLTHNDNDLDLQREPDSRRTLTLIEAPGHALLLNGQMFDSEVTERPRLGTTEEWSLVNPNYTDHPIHLHLVQFKLLDRRGINDDYLTKWNADNGTDLPLQRAPTSPNVEDYVNSAPLPLEVAESGWKDTVVVPANSVTRIRVRWTPQDTAKFPFDPTEGSYVWHCHMLEHEDNEMMRPLKLDD